MVEWREGLWMTEKERDRLKVLHEVRQRHITQKQAATELGLSVCWYENRWYGCEHAAITHYVMGCAGDHRTGKCRKP